MPADAPTPFGTKIFAPLPAVTRPIQHFCEDSLRLRPIWCLTIVRAGMPGDDFGQKVDLTSRIREILVNYPAGTTVLKEFVQNADDGGAGVVRFCIDERTFPSATLAHERLAPFQGPSLLVFNDGVFTERDFESIQNIGDSQKKSELAKTGRFGIGFNSCYHITELPSFLSRTSLIMFDPQAKYLPDVNPANPGKKIDVLSQAVQLHFPDQIEPFRAFGSDLASDYKATLFRLPLRTAEQAKTSKVRGYPAH